LLLSAAEEAVAVVPAHWGEFGVAAAGAAGALAGLLIVAISVNVRRIIDWPPARVGASATVVGLAFALVVSLALLVPEQPLWALAIEIAVAAATSLALQSPIVVTTVRRRHELPGPEHRAQQLMAVLTVGAYVPIVPAVVFLALGSEIGVYILAGGIAVVMLVLLAAAWVLLIEVVREQDLERPL
jgi:hypothetical protein